MNDVASLSIHRSSRAVRRPSSAWLAARKLLRFSATYGPRRAWAKALGRLRGGYWPASSRRGRGPGVGLIGCGQFSFSTIVYFLRAKARIVVCFDTDASAAVSLARLYGVENVASSADELFTCPAIEVVYIASNHASHAEYAVTALRAGKRVYVEKPIAVSHAQLTALCTTYRTCGKSVFAGYNRPFSGAVRDIHSRLSSPEGPLTLGCFVSGHRLPVNHWYRRPEEGTRVCGNVGHWLDLALHILSWRDIPDRWKISLAWSDGRSRDDDLAVTLVSEAGDLVNIVMTARSEPFEGINETINLQWCNVIAKIDDFRFMTLWESDRRYRYRYWPKDVGHRRAVLQPFDDICRNWREVELSSLLMLRIAYMVVNAQQQADFSFANEWAALGIE